MPDLTEADKRNGWDEDSLRRYQAQRDEAAAGIVNQDPDYRKKRKPREANHRYNPFKWRR